MSEILHPHESAADFIEANRLFWSEGPVNFSFPPTEGPQPDSGLTEQTVTPGGPTTLRFVFWAHEPQNQEHVIPALEGCDVIAYETLVPTAFKNTRTRETAISYAERWDEMHSNIVSAGYGDAERSGLQSVADTVLEKCRKVGAFVLSRPSYKKIFAHFSGNIEGSQRLDVGPNEASEFKKLDRTGNEARKLLTDAISEGSSSWDDLKNYLFSFVEKDAHLIEFREALVRDQLDALVQRYPGRTIGVLYGASHRALTRMIDGEDIAMQRSFAKRESYYENSLKLHDVLRESMRIGQFPDREANMLIAYYLAGKSEDLRGKIDKLSEDDLHWLAVELEELWKNPIEKSSSETRKLVRQRRRATRRLIQAATYGINDEQY